jgi:hypothetical protein
MAVDPNSLRLKTFIEKTIDEFAKDMKPITKDHVRKGQNYILLMQAETLDKLLDEVGNYLKMNVDKGYKEYLDRYFKYFVRYASGRVSLRFPEFLILGVNFHDYEHLDSPNHIRSNDNHNNPSNKPMKMKIDPQNPELVNSDKSRTLFNTWED